MTKTTLNKIKNHIIEDIYNLIDRFSIKNFEYLEIGIRSYNLGYELPIIEKKVYFSFDIFKQEVHLIINNEDLQDYYYDNDLVVTEDDDSLVITLTERQTKEIISTFNNVDELISYLQKEYNL